MSDLRGIDIIFDVSLVFIGGGAVFFLLAAGVLWNKTSFWIPCVLAFESLIQLLFFLRFSPWTRVSLGILKIDFLITPIFGLFVLLTLLVPFAIWRMALQIRDMKAQLDTPSPPSAEDISGNPVEDSNR